ncbi:MAG: hypothetical protein H7233_01855 [Pseudorhodobacter sp.]|nr:hypothetical protein [Frankiaceae bacterium]
MRLNTHVAVEHLHGPFGFLLDTRGLAPHEAGVMIKVALGKQVDGCGGTRWVVDAAGT